MLHKLPFPLGVSFYTFAAISYLVDVGRGDMPAEESPLNLTAFLCFFGTITAGPICRARTLLPQLRQEHRFDAARTVTALQLFALGLFRKVAVADPLYTYASQVFGDIPGHGGLSLLAATLAYTFYLYFDFAGYSEMAGPAPCCWGWTFPKTSKRPSLPPISPASGTAGTSAFLPGCRTIYSPRWCGPMPRSCPSSGRRSAGFRRCSVCSACSLCPASGTAAPCPLWCGACCRRCTGWAKSCCTSIWASPKEGPGPVLWAKRLGVFVLWNLSMVFFAMGSAVGQPAGGQYGVGEAFAILRGYGRGLSLSRFAAESWAAVRVGFMPTTGWFWPGLPFVAFCFAAALRLDWLRAFSFKNKGEELVLKAQKPQVRWALYYLLTLCCFAGLVMQNGGFGGGSLPTADFKEGEPCATF